MQFDIRSPQRFYSVQTNQQFQLVDGGVSPLPVAPNVFAAAAGQVEAFVNGVEHDDATARHGFDRGWLGTPNVSLLGNGNVVRRLTAYKESFPAPGTMRTNIRSTARSSNGVTSA